MQLLESRTSGSRRKRHVKTGIILGLVLLVAAGWFGWEKGRPRYLQWKQQRALAQARNFIEQHDAPNAQMALEVALRTIPGNPETLRVAADLLEQVGSPQAMRVRRAMTQIAPDSAEDAAALVMCCLRFHDYNAGKDALASTPPSVAAQPPMLQAALAFALATDNSPVADALFVQLKRVTPNEPDLQVAHALLRLKHPREEVRTKAQTELDQIARSNPRYALRIHREFISLALQRRDVAEAKRRLGLVLADPGATFNDRLQKANLELVEEHQPFAPIFDELSSHAQRNDADAAQFIRWLLVQKRGTQAQQWLEQLPEAMRHSLAVSSVRADVLAQLKDWDAFEQALADGAWGPIPKDTLRLALAARTVDTPARPTLRHDTWELALASARGQLLSLRILQRIAAAWEWADESERTLWSIARGFPDQTWAHQALFNLYRSKKDTASMRNVMGSLRDADGTVPRYQHDWALLSLLLDPTSNWNLPKQSMHSLHEAEPTNATYITGYAFALAQAGKADEAQALVARLSEADRDYPPRQPFLAFVYGVAKKSADLGRAERLGEGVNYLPEESYLFTRAREELQRKPPKPVSAPAKSAPKEVSTPST